MELIHEDAGPVAVHCRELVAVSTLLRLVPACEDTSDDEEGEAATPMVVAMQGPYEDITIDEEGEVVVAPTPANEVKAMTPQAKVLMVYIPRLSDPCAMPEPTDVQSEYDEVVLCFNLIIAILILDKIHVINLPLLF